MKDNIKTLSISICIVLLLLCVCMTIDYADEDIITNINNTSNINIPENAVVVNNSSAIILNKNAGIIVAKSSDRIYCKYPLIGMWAKPSCGCKYSYTWHYREYVNYCPNCHHYGTLRKNPKGVPEREYTCYRCSSDFCGCCGKEKMGYSKVYLRKA